MQRTGPSSQTARSVPIVVGATIERSPLLRAITSDTWALAREVSCRADRVEMENCYQFTEHYFQNDESERQDGE
jgi:hypothetical protein